MSEKNKESGELNFERGLYFFKHDDPVKAVEEFKLFLESGKKKNDLEEMAISLNALGRVFASTGKWDEAISFFKRSLKIYDTMDDDRGCAILRHDLGRINFNLNNLDEAEADTIICLELYEKVRDPEGITSALGQLSQIQRSKGSMAEALKTAERGLAYSQKVVDTSEEVNFLADISNLLREIDRPSDSLSYSVKALEIAQKNGDPRQTMVVLGQLGQLYRKVQDYDTALRYSREGLNMAMKLRDPNEAAIFLQDLGRIHQVRGESHLAEENFLESLDLFEKLGNLPGVVYNFKSLAIVKFSDGDHRSTVSYYLQAMRNATGDDISLFKQTLLDFFPVMRNLMEAGTFREVAIAARGAINIIVDQPEATFTRKERDAFLSSMRAIDLFASAEGKSGSENTMKAIQLAKTVDLSIKLGLTEYFEKLTKK